MIFCFGLIGIKSAAALKERAAFINRLILCTDKISQYIKMGNAEKGEILKSTLPAFMSYEQEHVIIDKNIRLSLEDIRLIEEFFVGLGMGDIDAELVRCNAFKNLFKKQLIEAEKDVEEKHRLFTVSGFILGLILSFLWW